jgi:NADP-reducing hydrogenase subunit HndC
MYRSHVLVCGGTGCTSSGSPQIMEALNYEIKKQGLEDEVAVVETGCHGLCALGPIMIVYPDATFYSMVQPGDIPEIVSEHLLKGRVVTRLLYQETVSPTGSIKALADTDFYKKQHRIALRNCGVINPEDIEEYIGTGGYQALGKVLTEMTPDEVIQTLLDAGLRGRGGAGFPTGLKWKLCKQNDADQKYVCCNADEGDPGAFMDRSVLEGDPHALLEAMAIAGYAIGSNQGYVYVRAEYPIAVDRLTIAIKQAREMELLGKNIFGTGFDFDVDIRLGAGAFVCGEETALMTSIEGKRGEPRPRPPFPAQKGLFGKPSILNNVETYANIPQIILNGPEWFASMGTEKSKGTKVFALGGKINNTGLVEVPMGTTLRTVVDEIGGGIKDGKKFKAVQIGGPSGGCLTEEHLDMPLDFDSLKKVGAMIGSGGLVVMDEDTCMVEVARFFMNFTQNESCGKCVPCREGTRRMLEILTRIVNNEGSLEDLDLLEDLSSTITETALCGLGQSACKPVQSTLKYFRDEYLAHVVEKHCPHCNGRKKELHIDPELCKGCGKCMRQCPMEAISGQIRMPHVIDTEKCIKCGACWGCCPFGAIREE